MTDRGQRQFGPLTGNLVLDSLGEDLRGVVMQLGELVALPLKAVLMQPGEQPAYVYFITGGIISVVVRTSEGKSAEVSMHGREGVLGAASLLRTAAPVTEAMAQVAGQAWRIRASVAKRLFDETAEFRMALLQYLQGQLLLLTQSAGCNRLHGAESRLARWLLMVSDRLSTDSLPLTQEFLAEMLGTQRSTAALVSGVLQQSGAIAVRHGLVQIHRPELEKHACECYPTMRSVVPPPSQGNGSRA